MTTISPLPAPAAQRAGAFRAARPSGPAPGADVYVISTHKVRERTGEPPYDWVPYGTQHAWRPGAQRTLCGEWTAGWTVFWELRFSAAAQPSCSGCIEASLPEASRRRLDRVRPLPA